LKKRRNATFRKGVLPVREGRKMPLGERGNFEIVPVSLEGKTPKRISLKEKNRTRGREDSRLDQVFISTLKENGGQRVKGKCR